MNRTQSPHMHTLYSATTGRDFADKLFELYQGNFPLLWDRIGYDKSRLGNIFEFFFQMRELLASAPPRLLTLLHSRLAARVAGDPLPLPFGHEVVLEHLSDLQINAVNQLGTELGPAFDLFAAGALAARRQFRQRPLPLGAVEPDAMAAKPVDLPEPDGAAFFFWAEFGLLAMGAGHDCDTWKRVLQVLLRAERVFLLTYGQMVGGRVPPNTSFGSYTPSSHRPIRPDVVDSIDYSCFKSFGRLERAVTRCALTAFPAGAD